jgi:hypothetical protein
VVIEEECEGVLLTKLKNKPPLWKAENENLVKCVLRKEKGRAWTVLVARDFSKRFKTRRAACRFIANLSPVSQTDFEGVAL